MLDGLRAWLGNRSVLRKVHPPELAGPPLWQPSPRILAANLVAGFRDGRVSNDHLEDNWPFGQSADTLALAAIYRQLWFFWCALTPDWRFNRTREPAENVELLTRCELFLRSRLAYEWPNKISPRPAVGDLSVWPFFRQADLQAAEQGRVTGIVLEVSNGGEDIQDHYQRMISSGHRLYGANGRWMLDLVEQLGNRPTIRKVNCWTSIDVLRFHLDAVPSTRAWRVTVAAHPHPGGEWEIGHLPPGGDCLKDVIRNRTRDLLEAVHLVHDAFEKSGFWQDPPQLNEREQRLV